MKVFIVTYGNYDDYQILSVFLFRELAEKYLIKYIEKVNTRKRSQGRVEEWEVIYSD